MQIEALQNDYLVADASVVLNFFYERDCAALKDGKDFTAREESGMLWRIS